MADREAYINGITFGVGRSFVLESVELPQNEYRTQDTENPVGDGMIFGRDRITPGSLTLNILVLGEDGGVGFGVSYFDDLQSHSNDSREKSQKADNLN